MALTDREKVRLRIGDSDADDRLFTDDEIDSFLEDNGDVVLLACADASEALAGTAALLAKLQKTANFTVDRKSIAAELRANAVAFRRQAESVPSAFVAQIAASQPSAEEILRNSSVDKNWEP